MRPLALLFLCLSLSANAQNWALLNPAYKYNYSNDGTDTISDQIFVTHIDTLGPDSFRYELNRIGVVCDTCPASLGGPCDGCYVRVNQPQFLQRSAIRSGDFWWFHDPDTFLIRTDVPSGTSWPFNPDSSIVATAQQRSAALTFGIADSTQLFLLSNGGSLRVSKSFGVLHFQDGGAPLQYGIVGVHGPDIGRLTPTLEQFFPFHEGDVIQFMNQSHIDYHTFVEYEQFHIEQRISQSGHLTFSGTSFYRSFGPNGQDNGSRSGPRNWILDMSTMPVLGAISSTPNEVVDLGELGFWPSTHVMMVAEHKVDTAGHYVIQAGSFSYSSLFYIVDTLPDLFVPTYLPPVYANRYVLDTQLGIRILSTSSAYNNHVLQTQGAVIEGDTIGTFFDQAYFDWYLPGQGTLFPIPASDQITVPDARPGSSYTVFDLLGQVVFTGTWSTTMSLDIMQMLPGSYLLVQDTGAQRFIIAR